MNRSLGLSDVGRIRAHNEDAFRSNDGLGLFVLADGMGGHLAGEVASNMAVEMVVGRYTELAENHRVGLGLDEPEELSDGGRQMVHLIHLANKAIYESAQQNPNQQGMGTTIVALLLEKDRAVYAHLGDSRIYLFRGGELIQLTRDHSLVQEQLDRGLISQAEARKSEMRHVVTRAMGIEPEVDVSVGEELVRSGDRFLLCSDGLTDLVEDSEIREVLAVGGEDLTPLAQRLIDLANARGGKDNVTVILVETTGPQKQQGILESIRDWFARLFQRG
ncbi:MAG: hypothetical protein COX57_04005 [Alphaproteobacteria bacterium CG_4_10_14_0_2_um_filter_63_37]|nr:MAG: hypothetical protein AUJ55_08125 [Proteobacteria bacterium CG1_02_64_396]PJA25314.1 MAG: hypothetical protein COX57_04005 [Alphaproteobacteria bacterium CG_4_10_14_0_2_um_filter_63_37]